MNDDLRSAIDLAGEAATDAITAYVDACVHAAGRALRQAHPTASAVLLNLGSYYGTDGEPLIDRVFLDGEDQVLDPYRHPDDVDVEEARTYLARAFAYRDHLPSDLHRLTAVEGNRHGLPLCVLPFPAVDDAEKPAARVATRRSPSNRPGSGQDTVLPAERAAAGTSRANEQADADAPAAPVLAPAAATPEDQESTATDRRTDDRPRSYSGVIEWDLELFDSPREAAEAMWHYVRDSTGPVVELVDGTGTRWLVDLDREPGDDDITVTTAAADRLIALAEQPGVDPVNLDDLVHDGFSAAASSVNNQGLDAQIRYLVERYGKVVTENDVRAAARSARTADEAADQSGA
ncbi:hypothetical protein ALI22I_20515 [Saccharothrix sp. ALI-22-I]|uniref:hypothetical protein n=1 Tax=Saccharothrix sp. ALI-22-I TaxID=1933778 RepID=UPI00097CB208|nr:hypothetical protein [Saccharothrix sp. ALI-22-I]ONI88124.1 hypothetical protein ALI22I_20515 [Saccharothrix sp. ALI-22-I]